ncbi:hypothetical protein ACFFF7_02595 [Novosphingobium aquiterrae]|uniref:PD-(D/E)XK nuclease superfamily protein n=1 Tax=Novosphingobium aquiterrae TaxID=624388 RepID=A0ABV6PFF7_9SPHN
MARALGKPVLIDSAGDQSRLERIFLGSGNHSEKWLQALIQAHPDILPITEIEPGFGTLVPAAREVPCGHGFIDNLYLTPSGDIVFVETKLWRNSEIRREVVAQTLDYISALTSMSFEDFQLAVSQGENAPKRLYDLVSDLPDALAEAEFIDAVASNLRRGRMLAMVLGDGIRSETETLARLLQSHAGAHFTFALVEVATWRTETGAILAIPSTLAKTVMIERGIVRLEGAGVRVDPVPARAKPRAQSLSMGDFMAGMAKLDAALPQAIYALIDALEPIGVYAELKASLSFKFDHPDLNRTASFGYIDKQGRFWTNPTSLNLPERVWRPYLETLAVLVGGYVVDQPTGPFVAISSRSAPRINDLLPQHREALVEAIEKAVRDINEGSEA